MHNYHIIKIIISEISHNIDLHVKYYLLRREVNFIYFYSSTLRVYLNLVESHYIILCW